MGVFVSDFVSALAVRIGPSRQARADTDCEGRYKVRYKNTHMIIYIIYIYIWGDYKAHVIDYDYDYLEIS